MQLIDFIKDPENKQKIMIGVFVAVIMTTIFVLFNYYSGKKPTVAVPGATPATALSPAAGIRLDTEILESPVFQNLKKIGKYPIEPKKDELGRMNPFIPY